MKLSFHTVGLNNRPLPHIIERVAAAGYPGIEIGCEDIPWAPPPITPDLPVDEQLRLAAHCADAGLEVAAIGGHIPMIHTDANARRAAVDYVNGCTDMAVRFGAPVNHILSGPRPDGVGPDTAWRQFAEAVEACTDYARTQGIALAIEGVFANAFRTPADFRRLARELPAVPWKVNLDVSHLAVHGEDPYRFVQEFGDRVAHVHLKDASGRHPDFAFPPLGQGTLDFRRLAELLRQAGYGGWMSVEYEAQAFGWDEDEDTRLTTSLDFCRELLG